MCVRVSVCVCGCTWVYVSAKKQERARVYLCACVCVCVSMGVMSLSSVHHLIFLIVKMKSILLRGKKFFRTCFFIQDYLLQQYLDNRTSVIEVNSIIERFFISITERFVTSITEQNVRLSR